jgi:hypothetical protein
MDDEESLGLDIRQHGEDAYSSAEPKIRSAHGVAARSPAKVAARKSDFHRPFGGPASLSLTDNPRRDGVGG